MQDRVSKDGSRLREPSTPSLNPGLPPILGGLLILARILPEPGCPKLFVCNPYWMQHLLRPLVSEQLGNGNKVGSSVSTYGALTKAGYGGMPEGPYYSVVTLGQWVTCFPGSNRKLVKSEQLTLRTLIRLLY